MGEDMGEDMGELTLPDDAVLVHIGPMKTGTTAIQYALSDARSVLAEHGVRYPATRHRGTGHYRQMDPVLAVLGRRYVGLDRPPIEEWEGLVREVRDAPHERVCISSEDLGSARPEHARRIVEDLGADRVHVVATARRLDRLLPSQWQQRVKNREQLAYSDWLEVVLGPDPTRREAYRFWRAHDLTRMVEAWAPLVGPNRFIVIASDDSDRRMLHDTFEGLLGLPAQTLQSTSANSSLSAAGVELVRHVNIRSAEREWPERDYRKMIRRGMADRLKGMRTDADAAIPPIPAWAVELVNKHADERDAAFAAWGVRVVGDLSRLRGSVDDAPGQVGEMPGCIGLEQVAAAVDGLRIGAARQFAEDERRRRRALDDLEARHRRRMQALQRRVDEHARSSARGRVRRLLSRARGRLLR